MEKFTNNAEVEIVEEEFFKVSKASDEKTKNQLQNFFDEGIIVEEEAIEEEIVMEEEVIEEGKDMIEEVIEEEIVEEEVTEETEAKEVVELVEEEPIIEEVEIEEIEAEVETEVEHSLHISNKEQVKDLFSKVIPYEMGYAQSLVIGRVALYSIVGVSTVYSELLEGADNMSLLTEVGEQRVSKGTDNVINVKLEEGGKEVLQLIINGGLYKKDQRFFYVVKAFGRSRMFDIKTKEEVSVNLEEATKYIMISGSPSGIRESSFMMIKESLKDGFVDFMNKRYNNSYFMNLEGRQGGRRELSDGASRMFHAMTPQVDIGNINTVAIFMGELMDGGSDGTEYTSVTFMRERLEESLSEHMGANVTISTDAVVGLGFQQRPATNKSLGVVNPDSSVNAKIIAHKEAGTKVSVFQRSELDAEKSLELFNREDEIVIVTDDEDFELGVNRVDLFTDLNATKLPYDLSMDLPMWILKVIKDPGKVNLNGQVYSKIINTEEGRKYVEETLQEGVDSLFDGFEKSVKDGEGFVTEKQLRSSDIVGTLNKLVSKETLSHFPNLRAQVMSSQYQSAIKMASTLRVPVEGRYATAMGDPTQLYGLAEDLLAPEEIFINCSSIKESSNVLVIKYPSVHYREFITPKVVTRRELRNRIAKLPASRKTRRALSAELFSLDSAIVVVSTSELLKQTLAGFDMDTDALAIFTDSKIVDIIKEKPLSVMIEGQGITDKSQYDLGFDSFGKVVEKNIENAGLGIGNITNISVLISGLLSEDSRFAVAVLQKVFSDSSSSKEYVPLTMSSESSFSDTVYVSEEEALRVIGSLEKSAEITLDNVSTVVSDLVSISRYVQETEIDFPKTGVNTMVRIALEVEKKKLASHLHRKVERVGLAPTSEEGGMEFEYELRKTSVNIQYLRNYLHSLRVKKMDEVTEVMNSELKEVMSKGFSDDIKGYLHGVFNSDVFANTTLDIYRDIQMRFSEDISPKDMDGTLVHPSTEEVRFFSRLRRARINALLNSFRLGTSEMSLVERGKLMLSLSIMNKNNEERAGVGNRFFSIAVPELLSVLEDVSFERTGKSCGAVGSKLIVNEKKNDLLPDGDSQKITEGMEVEFDEFGNSKYELIIPNAELEGKYVLRKINNNWSAVKSVRSVLTETSSAVDLENGFALRIHRADQDKAYGLLGNAEKVRLYADKENGDSIYLEDGTFVGRYMLPNGSSELSQQLHGKVFDVADLLLTNNNGYKAVTVIINNGVAVVSNLVGGGVIEEESMIEEEVDEEGIIGEEIIEESPVVIKEVPEEEEEDFLSPDYMFGEEL